MKITIEKTETVKTEIELPLYFTTLTGWYHMVLPDNKILHVTESGVQVGTGMLLDHCQHYIKPCTQDEFVQAYVKAINLITSASGIEHLPLILEPNQNY